MAGDTREAMAVVTELGGADWFILGDRDIGLHLVRSERLRAGEPLSAVTADFARRYGLRRAPAARERRPPAHAHRHAERRARVPGVARRAPRGRPRARRALRGRAGRAARARRARGDRERGRDRARALQPVRLARSDPGRRRRARRGRGAARARRRDHADDRRPRPSRARSPGMLETLGHEVGAVGVARVLAPLAAGVRARQRRRGRAPRRRARSGCARPACRRSCATPRAPPRVARAALALP